MRAMTGLVVREYLRVSQDKDGQGKSPAQQHEENLEAFEELGWTVHPSKPYKDSDRSASRYAKKAREGYDQLITDLTNDTFGADVLAMWELSRGSRKVLDWAILVELLIDRGVRVWDTSEERLLDPAKSSDKTAIFQAAITSETSSDDTSKRIKRDVRASAKLGRPHGKKIYGYQRFYVAGEKGPVLDRIEADPAEAPIVIEAAQRVLAHETFYSIARDFNQRGIPPRRPKRSESRANDGWTPAAVKQMLTMPAYAGKRQHRGEIVGDAIWEGLIDFEVWEKLQRIMSPASRKRPEAWREFVHLLGGIAYCGVCGASLRVAKQNAGRKTMVPVLDASGQPVLDADGEPVLEARKKPRLDADGNPVLDGNGDPVLIIDRPTYLTYVCSGLPGRPGPHGKKGFHVAMKQEYLDAIITELVLARMERPDFLTGLEKRDDGSDALRQQLLAEIDGHREWLEQVRERAERERKLDLFFDQEARVEPKIKAAQDMLEKLSAMDPWVLDIARDGAIRESWETMDILSKRRVISTVMAPRLGLGVRGRRGLDPDRIDPGWK